MKFSTVISASALAATALAADPTVEFVTVLVNDLKANRAQYLGYVATAQGVPADVTNLALAVLTYTDDSYTTLIPGLNIPQIEGFASGLPWFSRIEAAITPAGAASSEAPAASSAAPESSAPAVSSAAPESSAPAASSAPASSAPPAVTSTGAANKLVGAGILSFGALVAALI